MAARRARRVGLPLGGGVLLAAYALVALIGVAAIRILTGLASPAVFGEANLILTFVALALSMATLPFSNTQLRYHSAAAQAGDADGFTRQVLLWSLGVAAGVWLLLLAGWAAAAARHATRLGAPGALAIGAILAGAAVRNVLFNRVQADTRRGLYAGLLVAEAALTLGGGALGLAASATVDGYVVGQAAGAAGLAALTLLLTWDDSRRLWRGGSAAGVLRRVWAYGSPFAPLAALGWLNNLADRYALGALMGTAAVGRYVAPFSLASRAFIQTNGALADLFRPLLFARVNAGEARAARSVFHGWLAAQAAASLCGLVALAGLGPGLARLLLAPAYRPGAVAIMLWIAAGYGVQGVCQTLDTRLMSLDRTRALVAPLALGGGATLLFSLALIPHAGPLGAAQATAAGFVLQALATAWRLRAGYSESRSSSIGRKRARKQAAR